MTTSPVGATRGMTPGLAHLALVFNALVWGLSWWPLRALHEQGLHPVWATVVIFVVGLLVMGSARPSAWRGVAQRPALWALALAAGATNAAFNWGVTTGEVVRVVLLFYLMPLWAVILAWVMLGERLSPAAGVRVVLALVGAVLVLLPESGGWPQFQGLADWLGLLGGMGFALTTVLLRGQAAVPASDRALAMFLGGLLLPGVLGWALWQQGWVSPWPAWSWDWALLAMAMGALFVLSNLALQYGTARVPVHLAAVLMLTEVVFAAASALWWGGEALSPTEWLGGGLILLTAVMAAREG